LGPAFPLPRPDHIEVLKLQQFWFFIEESWGEVIPEGVVGGELVGKVIWIEVSKADNKPNKEAPLILMPGILVDLEFVGDCVPK
jgi:hypothetical protein